MLTKGRFLNKQEWHSICSMHYEYNKDCNICNTGSWNNIYWYKIDSFIYKHFPKFWIWKANINPHKTLRFTKLKNKTMFKDKTKIENLILANGRVLLERTENVNIYKVLSVSKNANYESLGKKIEIGDFVICSEYLYSNNFKLNSKDYFIIKPSSISAYFS